MQNVDSDISSLRISNQRGSAFDELFSRAQPPRNTDLVSVDQRPVSLGQQIANGLKPQFPGADITVEYESPSVIQLRFVFAQDRYRPQFATIRSDGNGGYTLARSN